MKSSRVMKVFEQYVKKFDMNNNDIKTKYFHSLKVMELSRQIASSLNMFNDEEIVLCELISLFHEIGSFNKNPEYHKTKEPEEDNINKTLDILFNEGLLRKITSETKYDNLIKFAIYSLDKEGYPENIDSKIITFCNIIKDSHNLDNFKQSINYPYLDTRIDSYPSNMVYEEFKRFNKVNKRLTENNADEILLILSNIFALNYNYSYYIAYESKYVNKLMNSLTYTNNDIKKFFNSLENVLNIYIERKIGDINVRQEI